MFCLPSGIRWWRSPGGLLAGDAAGPNESKSPAGISNQTPMFCLPSGIRWWRSPGGLLAGDAAGPNESKSPAGMPVALWRQKPDTHVLLAFRHPLVAVAGGLLAGDAAGPNESKSPAGMPVALWRAAEAPTRHPSHPAFLGALVPWWFPPSPLRVPGCGWRLHPKIILTPRGGCYGLATIRGRSLRFSCHGCCNLVRSGA